MNVVKSVVAAAWCVAVLASPAYATDLDTARAKGMIGERTDGLVGAVVKNIALTPLIQSVNAGRKAHYRDTAAREGTNLDAVQAIAGARQIEKAHANGWYYMDANGEWKKD